MSEIFSPDTNDYRELRMAILHGVYRTHCYSAEDFFFREINRLACLYAHGAFHCICYSTLHPRMTVR